ncbi:hypothetical protein TWF506_002334 [Arthrobotrys conoides]|uniref:Dolichyl-phosphate-mannose--protein mannosyltransferase n=1 Tax=Arthrobotrys conoides TaxID=74498 RepID=A0AAN8N490_9PEZI
MADQSSVRQRKKGARGTTPAPASDDEVLSKAITKNAASSGYSKKKFDFGHLVTFSIVTALAFITRFYKLNHPNEVVFDEVHFGKFASFYLQRTYFFDVHPPFGKLLFALMGWFVGFDGDFKFDNIGDSYIDNKVPYVAFRTMPALLGSLTVSVVYLTMWESGYSIPAALLAAGLVLFDNAHIGQTRLILLDATLIFSMACSIFAYVRFYRMRHVPFSRKWWKWLLLTGVALSCVISTKYVGVFTFVTIGTAVAIDLWGLLDINTGLTIQEFGYHFLARAVGLIIVPFCFYLFWFQVHFAILYRSGTGDDFMTPAFQETLSDNLMTLSSTNIHYYDKITLRHKDTKAYLHSHTAKYPLRYDDGRISSQGQQVTGYPHNDTNNQWIILPAADLAEPKTALNVKSGDVIRLLHAVTNTMLLSHDVASPYYPTNQEFTTVDRETAIQRINDTLFELKVEGVRVGHDFKTMSSQFKLIHYPSKVAMWTHSKPLPDWGFKQQEINGNKNVQQTSNIWYADDIPSLPENDPRNDKTPKKVKTLPFLVKWFELQRAMFHHNNALTSSHPYASHPIQWPYLLRGVSFWTKNETREQIYFLGNPIGWWLASSLLAVFAGIIGADQVTKRRGIDALDFRTRSKLYNSTGYFFVAWATHYIAFFIMGRQLFLHHYLPAHLASSLVTGALLDFVFNSEGQDEAVPEHIKAAQSGKKPAVRTLTGVLPSSPSEATKATALSWIVGGVVLAAIIGGFLFFAPLTYGTPGLTVEEILQRKWLGYDLHFAK